MSFNTFSDLFYENAFVHRHLGNSTDEEQALLTAVGAKTLDEFVDSVVPQSCV